ncbi:hypothetical protein HHI36_020118 [Cryptolaemus montrouzieri]|uniref:F5/8 type C domain-containing protein n=1 Tax=Cryptolaemus montrouzieri TaxID=559131 RepID=A0ABD2NAZ9_9CUCU
MDNEHASPGPSLFNASRLRNNKNGGAWCPRQMVSRDSKEHLEIDLENLHVVTETRTQGRYGNGQGQEYAEEYMLDYWRPGLGDWVRWKNRSGKEVSFELLFLTNNILGNMKMTFGIRGYF